MRQNTDGPPLQDDRVGVPDGTLLYRRISPALMGGSELSGNCFRDWKATDALARGYGGPCMSVGLGNVLETLGLDPVEAMLGPYPGYGLAVLKAGDLRQLARSNGDPCPQGVMVRPEPTEPWHGVVFSMGVGDQYKKAVADARARRANWVVAPSQAP